MTGALAEQLFTAATFDRHAALFDGMHCHTRVGDYVDTVVADFAEGSDPATLTTDARAGLATHLAAVREAYAARPRPRLDRIVSERIARDLPFHDRLTVSGPVNRAAGLHGLTRAQQTDFADFGVLPPFTFSQLPRADLDAVEGVLDGLLSSDGPSLQRMDRRLNANFAYLFSRELLELALSDEIVQKVQGLLGDQVTFIGTSGPMYKAPGSGAQMKTQWHSADARGFGGGTAANLDLVSVWVALSDATVANGCMTLLPRSFPLNVAKERLVPHELFRDHINLPGRNAEVLAQHLCQLDAEVDVSTVEALLCRRLGFHDTPKLFYVDNASGFKKYSPFQSSVDQTMCLGVHTLRSLTRLGPVSLLASKGQFYLFTSQNTHASYPNHSDGWRKAISLRYVRTGRATQSTAIDSAFYLGEYVKTFPRCAEQLARFGKTPEDFRDAVPRVLVSGEIPAGQERWYLDRDALVASLEADNAWFAG